MNHSPRILIIGAGAIGCLVGGRLALTGHPVTLAGRARFAAIVREQGLVLVDETGRHVVRTVTAAASIAEAVATTPAPFDLAIFTVKSYDTESAASELQGALADRGAPAPALMSVQNGVGNEETLAARLPGAAIIAASITTPVSVEGPGAIHIDKPRYDLGMSPWQPPSVSPVFEMITAVMGRAGFAVKRYADARGMKWTKLLMNLLGNATSAILDEPPERVFADPALADLEIEAWREALAVMEAAGIPAVNMGRYPFRWLAPLIRRAPNGLIRPLLARQIGGARGGKLPSLHIDLHGGRTKNEVVWLNGAVVRQGAASNVPTPANRVLTDTVLALIDQPEARAAWKGNHRRLLDAVQQARRAPAT